MNGVSTWLGLVAVAGVFGVLAWLVLRTGRNDDDATHGGGWPGDVTGGDGL